MLNFLSYLVKAIVEVIATSMMCIGVFDSEVLSKTRYFGFSVLYVAITVGQLMSLYSLGNNLIVMILMTFIVTLAFNMKWISRLFSMIISMVLAAFCEGIVWLPVRYVTGLKGIEISPEINYFALITFGAALIELLCSGVVFWLTSRLKRKPEQLYRIFFIVSCLLSFLIVFTLVTFVSTPYAIAAIVIAISLLFLVVLCILLFKEQLHMQHDRLRLEFLEKQNVEQISHYTELYQYNKDIYRIKHDLKNYMISAQSLLNEKKYEELMKMLSSYTGMVHLVSIIDTGNPIIDAILTAKQREGKHINFSINTPQLKFCSIDQLDFAMLLATALDNAIEGSEGVESPHISIRIGRQGDIISLCVENQTVKSIEVRNNQLITTKTDEKHHGYGIREMQKITKKYNGHLSWNLEKQVFSMKILLQDYPLVQSLN